MICPNCSTKLQCRDTASNGTRTGRRYRCPSCHAIYYTVEDILDTIDEHKALAILSEKSRKKYSRSKSKMT